MHLAHKITAINSEFRNLKLCTSMKPIHLQFFQKAGDCLLGKIGFVSFDAQSENRLDEIK